MMFSSRPSTEIKVKECSAGHIRARRVVSFFNNNLSLESPLEEDTKAAAAAANFDDVPPLKASVMETNDSLSLSSRTPPLDQVTICSDDDSVTSFSSVSDTDEDDDEDVLIKKESTTCTTRPTTTPTTSTVPRSIFKQYWSKNGGGPGSLKRETPSSVIPPAISIVIVQPESASSSSSAYERSLKHQHQEASSPPPIVSSSSPRRSIFQKNCHSQSAPCFKSLASSSSSDATMMMMMMMPPSYTASSSSWIRKTKSTSALRPQSCLRSGRYSSNNNTRPPLTRSTSERSVNFDSQVKVALYEKSMERYAADGWSDYFAA